jgi:hypothetical protein
MKMIVIALALSLVAPEMVNATCYGYAGPGGPAYTGPGGGGYAGPGGPCYAGPGGPVMLVPGVWGVSHEIVANKISDLVTEARPLVGGVAQCRNGQRYRGEQ